MYNGVYHNPNDYWRRQLSPRECDKILHASRRFLWAIVFVCFLILCSLALCGCKSKKAAVSEKTVESDSVRIEYREKVVKVPVTVYVEVPVEKHVNMASDSSHLETSFAVSDAAMIWIDSVPFLRHTLENKAKRIARTDTVPVVEREKAVWKTRRVTYTKTEIREKQLSWWQKFLMWTGGIALTVLIILMVSFLIGKRLRR